jgi:hypothetical protein
MAFSLPQIDLLDLFFENRQIIRRKYPKIPRPLHGPNVSASDKILDSMNWFVG